MVCNERQHLATDRTSSIDCSRKLLPSICDHEVAVYARPDCPMLGLSRNFANNRRLNRKR